MNDFFQTSYKIESEPEPLDERSLEGTPPTPPLTVVVDEVTLEEDDAFVTFNIPFKCNHKFGERFKNCRRTFTTISEARDNKGK